MPTRPLSSSTTPVRSPAHQQRGYVENRGATVENKPRPVGCWDARGTGYPRSRCGPSPRPRILVRRGEIARARGGSIGPASPDDDYRGEEHQLQVEPD